MEAAVFGRIRPRSVGSNQMFHSLKHSLKWIAFRGAYKSVWIKSAADRYSGDSVAREAIIDCHQVKVVVASSTLENRDLPLVRLLRPAQAAADHGQHVNAPQGGSRDENALGGYGEIGRGDRKAMRLNRK